MASLSRLEVLNALVEVGLVPIFYHPDVEVARKVFAACIAGGARLLEFTNRGDFAVQTFAELIRHFQQTDRSAILGAGTIVDSPTAAMYIASGANFIVGPILNTDVARLCNRRKIAYVPGCSTLTEISNAEELGTEVVKVFPGDALGGPDYVRSLLGPSLATRILVTGNVEVSRDSILAWFKAGVTAVGIGSALIRKEWLLTGNFDAIREQTAQITSWIREARQSS